MRSFLELNRDESLVPYEYALLDFGVHLKLSRRMGWVNNTGGDGMLPMSGVKVFSPLIKRRKITHKRKEDKKERRRRKKKVRVE